MTDNPDKELMKEEIKKELLNELNEKLAVLETHAEILENIQKQNPNATHIKEDLLKLQEKMEDYVKQIEKISKTDPELTQIYEHFNVLDYEGTDISEIPPADYVLHKNFLNKNIRFLEKVKSSLEEYLKEKKEILKDLIKEKSKEPSLNTDISRLNKYKSEIPINIFKSPVRRPLKGKGGKTRKNKHKTHRHYKSRKNKHKTRRY